MVVITIPIAMPMEDISAKTTMYVAQITFGVFALCNSNPTQKEMTYLWLATAVTRNFPYKYIKFNSRILNVALKNIYGPNYLQTKSIYLPSAPQGRLPFLQK